MASGDGQDDVDHDGDSDLIGVQVEVAADDVPLAKPHPVVAELHVLCDLRARVK